MPQPEAASRFLSGLVESVRLLRPKRRIVFPEGDDPRVHTAARRLAQDGLVEPILIGKRMELPIPGVTMVEPGGSKYADILYHRRRARGVTEVEAAALAKKPLYHAALMVAAGDAHGFVGGASNSTADTVRAALHAIGSAPGVKTVSSSFVSAVHDQNFGHRGLLVMADCAIVVNPSAVELADIAIAAAKTTRDLLHVEPIVAMLSFSTKGSGKDKSVDRVVEAVKVIRARAPELNVDGELQAHAAIVPSVGASKAPGSTVAGHANTLIFPDLNAANIGVKLVERLGDGAAIGPILQGLAKPANDLSRGCSADDIYSVALVTALQS